MTQPTGERAETEVYMILVETQENEDGTGQYITTPVSYDLAGNYQTGARALTAEEAPEDITEFIETAVDELENLALSLVGAAVDSPLPPAECFVKLLSDFKGQPIELIYNMLAAMLVGAVVELRGDKEAEAIAEDVPADVVEGVTELAEYIDRPLTTEGRENPI